MNQNFESLKIGTATTTSSVLGQKVGTPEEYCPSILVRIPRSENRGLYQIDSRTFCGKDVWHCFECYVANFSKSLFFPLTIEYSSDSKYMVESKSLKLYLNSFNNGLENKKYLSKEVFITMVKKDLSKLLETLVSVYETSETRQPTYNLNSKHPALANNHNIIYEGFKSRCKVTNQPDFANVWIRLENPKKPYAMDFYKAYLEKEISSVLFSMKNENHFHEECCELIFNKLQEMFSPDDLIVNMNFTRRGGISICPVRSTTFNYSTYLWEKE